MTIKLIRVQPPIRLVCAWKHTGNARNPLVCVWTQAAASQSQDAASSNAETGRMRLCA